VRFSIVVVLLLGAGLAQAQDVPLPRERPASLLQRFAVPQQTANGVVAPAALAPAPELQGIVYPPPTPGPSACEWRLAKIANYSPLPVLLGPGECAAHDVVRLDSIKMPDRSAITLNPPAVLRCSLAEAVADWVRDDVAPAAAKLGSDLVSIVNYDSYSCRGRNRIVGAKLSEHGRANALDIRALHLANGVIIDPTNPAVAKDFRDAMRRSACGRFTTVLGPGSDGYHENHVHVDLAERTRGYRMCQWDVREPAAVASVPLPLPRPLARADGAAKSLPK
jgi:hypothetical protein